MWSAVSEATNDTAIEISSYALEWRKHVDGAPWHSAGTTDKTQLGFGGLDCGTVIEVRVRAVPTYSDHFGEWSGIVVATVESDATPCSVPSKPVLSSELGVVTIHWDGRSSTGASMEADFDHVEVGEGTSAKNMTLVSATQAGQGDYLITGLTTGSSHSYALRSVDHAGNQSAWSDIASVSVASAVPQETLDSINQDIAKAEADAKSAKTTADGKNRIYTQDAEPAHSGLTNGDLWQKLDANGHISSVNVWNGSRFAAYGLVADSLLVPDSINGSVLIKDGSIQANNIYIGKGEILTELLKARKIVTDDVAAGQFKGYVFTGAVFQSSETDKTGFRLKGNSLDMWDSTHTQTVHLDGEGKNNVLTGTFRTAVSGPRIQITPDTGSQAIGGSESYSGKSIVFMSPDFASSPEIMGSHASSLVGDVSGLTMWSGYKTAEDPGAFGQLQSRPRTKGATGAGITSEVYFTANTNYSGNTTDKSKAELILKGIGGSGATAYLTAYTPGGGTSQAGILAKKGDVRVGMTADANTQYVYFGGKLGGFNGKSSNTVQSTFLQRFWRCFFGGSGTGDYGIVSMTWNPPDYGYYRFVASADTAMGFSCVHTGYDQDSNTSTCSCQIRGYGTRGEDIYVCAFGVLRS